MPSARERMEALCGSEQTGVLEVDAWNALDRRLTEIIARLDRIERALKAGAVGAWGE